MNQHAIWVVAACGLVIAAGGPAAAAAKDDRERLQGTWKVVAGESRGKPAPEDAIKDLRWVIKGDKITGRGEDGKSFELTFQLDATKKPRAIDFNNAARKETVLGIYTLEGKQWKLCVGAPGEKRPTGFATRENLKVALFILEREK
jgi:uncharacterized protein (TIGR03067 family)